MPDQILIIHLWIITFLGKDQEIKVYYAFIPVAEPPFGIVSLKVIFAEDAFIAKHRKLNNLKNINLFPGIVTHNPPMTP